MLTWLAPAPALAAALVVVWQLRQQPVDLRPRLVGSAPAIALGLETPREPVTVPPDERARLALRRLETADPSVVLYLAESARSKNPGAHL